MAAQIVSITMTNPYADGENTIVVTWTSATGGTVTAAIASVYSAALTSGKYYPAPTKIKGFVARVVTNPGATTPSSNYDITLTDVDGVDIMNGTLLDRSATLSEEVKVSPSPYLNSETTLTITNAGDAKNGTITIYLADSEG